MKELFEKIYKGSMDDFLNLTRKNLINNRKMFIVTANPETFMCSKKDNELKKMLLDKETTIVPDGIGIVKAGKSVGYNLKERIPGIEISYKLFEFGDELKKTLYLFGAKEDVIHSLRDVIEKKYPNIEIVGSSNGYIKDKDIVFKEIVKLSPDIIMVALGIPEQEKIIYHNLNKFRKGIFIGVGGTFDVISGKKKRAPKVFVKLNLEWLYRILKEPKRIKRFYKNNIKFLTEVKAEVNEKNNRLL